MRPFGNLGHPKTYHARSKALITIFDQQCERRGDKVVVKAKTGGDCVQNPSDLDATYDGHKGPGYPVQIAETCVPRNEVQLITAALPETACDPDAAAVPPMLDQLANAGRLPEELLADTLDTSDENVQAAEVRGVDLIGPVPGRAGVHRRDADCRRLRGRRADRRGRRLPRGPPADVVFAGRGDDKDAGRDAGIGVRGVPVPQAMSD